MGKEKPFDALFSFWKLLPHYFLLVSIFQLLIYYFNVTQFPGVEVKSGQSVSVEPKNKVVHISQVISELDKFVAFFLYCHFSMVYKWLL